MKTLFLAWQAPTRRWYTIGRLDASAPNEDSLYRFGYTRGALEARNENGFSPLPAFPMFEKSYKSTELFPLFRNRVLASNRRDFREYLASLDLPPVDDPVAILAVTGGERRTDSLEVFPQIVKDEEGNFRCRFFLHGLRHFPDRSRDRALALAPGDDLGVSIELNNPTTRFALQLTTRTDYDFVGWTPHYLVPDLLQASAQSVKSVIAKVARVNGPDVPLNRRVLIEFSGKFPIEYQPMSTSSFQLIESKAA